MDKRMIGKFGEKYVEKFLISRNYGVVGRNFRSKFGEIDLIAFDRALNETVFVEVKTRTNDFFGEPEDAVDCRKKAKILKTAIHFLNSSRGNRYLSWRVDVIAVKLDGTGKFLELNHFKNIFDGT